MRNQMLLASVAAMALGACVGGLDPEGPGGGGGQNAKQLFTSTVAPLLSKCQSCHVGAEVGSTNMFLGNAGPSGFYDALVNDRAVNGGFDPNAASLLHKGQHDGPAWLPDEAAKITAWLEAEAEARGSEVGTGGTPDTRSARGASMAFAACLSDPTIVEAFTTTQAFQVANLNSANGRCYSCHEPGGAGGAYWGRNNNYLDMLNKWQEEVFFTGTFQPQLQPDNSFKIGPAENKICNKGTEKDDSAGFHPEFDCQQNGGVALTNLKTFIGQVQQKLDAGQCPTPGFKMPTL